MFDDKQPTLVSLAESIGQQASTLHQLLTDTHLPQPSFVPGGRKDWADADCHPKILATRSQLIDDTQALLNLALGPTDLIASYCGSICSEIDVLRTLNELKVQDAVPLEGDMSVTELARVIGVKDIPALQRQLRYAYLMGLFRETEDGRIGHSALSAALPDSSAWVQWRTGKLACQGSHQVANTILRRPRPEDMSPADAVLAPCALADPRGHTRSFWEQIEDCGTAGEGCKETELYSRAMKGLMLHQNSGGTASVYLRGLDWGTFPAGTAVVDIGGGNGHVEVEMAPHMAGTCFIVQDRPQNEEPARALIHAHGLTGRIDFQGHDFRLPQPDLPGEQIPGIYLLIRILQDWSDAQCILILKHLIIGMEKHGAKLWIVGRLLPDGLNEMPVHKEKNLRNMDLLGFTLHGGGDRSVSGLNAVLKATDERLRINRITRFSQSVLSFTEVVLD